ncbi:hypothetical protein ABPG77_003505 [Micractinium sp. CCAP 211/92]
MEQAQRSPFKLAVVFREQSKEQAVQQDEAGRPQTSPPPVLNPRHGARSSRSYRGVSGDKCRYEAHVWAQRKQIFLGCYYNEELAARAYDLASIALRGQAACTNFPAEQYAAELAASPQQIETLAPALREQAKALGRPPSPPNALQPWEQTLSEVVSGQASLGLFASEEEAARAVDRALLARDGPAAGPHLNFPLSGYLYLLDSDQVEQEVQLGLLPVSAAQPKPARSEMYVQPSPFAIASSAQVCQSAGALQAESMAPPAPLPLPRRASITPRHSGHPTPSPFSPLN